MRLPKYIEPRKLAQKNGYFDGFLLPEDMPRVSETIDSFEKIRATLAFDIDVEKRRVMDTNITGTVKLLCQRCLEPVEHQLKASATFALVWDEERAEQLPGRFEPWIVGEDPQDLHAILEEEVLLSLPVVAYHEEPCVDASVMSVGDSAEQTDTPEARENPFKVLETLKNTSDKPQ